MRTERPVYSCVKLHVASGAAAEKRSKTQHGTLSQVTEGRDALSGGQLPGEEVRDSLSGGQQQQEEETGHQGAERRRLSTPTTLTLTPGVGRAEAPHARVGRD